MTIIKRTSEQQWLSERQKRLTATDVGRLYASGGPATFAAIKAEKHGARTFFGNKYTDWGREREPLIIEHLAFLHDIVPNDDLYVSGDRAATPDGVSVDALAEVKTTVRAWDGVDELKRVKPQYYAQVQWAQLVCERDRTWFAFEAHENFVPLPVEHFEIARDEALISELLELEERFWEFMQSDDQADEWSEFMARYVEAEAVLKEAAAEVEALKQELRDKQGDEPLAAKTPFGSISYAFPKPRSTFDQTAFKKAHKDLAEQFTRLVAADKPTLRITPKG